ncbi:unnamed protein product [Mytilus edulis]|uniref:Uncharacterized protein n=1 Tax=Mytilus edulis TaxID=6550 RepID=A0A8S3T3G4_MYTED|nr:unnamed protein product [Mytilus edulis]
MKVNSACNGNQMCEQLTNGCDDCSRLLKFAYISFSCKQVPNAFPLQTESGVAGIVVGVIVGILIIIESSKKSDDKHNIDRHHVNADHIGNENIANCNSEISTNMELTNLNSKQNNYEMAKPMNESEKDNYVFHENQYDVSRGNNCSEPQQGIYSRAVDTVYDSASHSRQNNVSDQTYDHAFGPTTEDTYDIANN